MSKTHLLALAIATIALVSGCGSKPAQTGTDNHQGQVTTFSAHHSPASPLGKAKRSVDSTPTGILLDTAWKQQEYAFALKNVQHPAWGLAHAERDLQNALTLAAQEKLTVDHDVLFAAAYLHDLGGLGTFQKPGIDHAVRSAELAMPLLQSWGFPMEKWPTVKEVILGHVYYGPAPTGPEAKVFHDADVLDFLGTMGIVRIVATTEEEGPTATLAGPFKTLHEFATQLPGKLVTDAARAQAKVRVAEMNQFFQTLDPYAFEGNAL
jgi:uncharacterized protein